MFPWESGILGSEQTPVWAMTGPLEHLITGCVAYGVWNYFRVTQDVQWLRKEGFTLISKAAEFWESRVILRDDGMYHIQNVVGSDEYAQNVDDDAFTNAIAQEALRIYNKAANILDVPLNPAYD